MTARLKQNRQAAYALWRQVPYLQAVPTDVVNALADAATSRVYSAGEMIFAEGDPVAGLFLIEQGTVKIARFSNEGREHTLLTLSRGDTFNDVAALDGGPNPATAIASTESVLWRIQRDLLREIARRSPELSWALIESVARRTRYLIGITQDLALRNVRGRVAHLLLQQAEAYERGETPPMLTQEEIASHLGTVREVIGRTLRSLAAEGIIEIDRHRMVILDRARLEAEADV